MFAEIPRERTIPVVLLKWVFPNLYSIAAKKAIIKTAPTLIEKEFSPKRVNTFIIKPTTGP